MTPRSESSVSIAGEVIAATVTAGLPGARTCLLSGPSFLALTPASSPSTATRPGTARSPGGWSGASPRCGPQHRSPERGVSTIERQRHRRFVGREDVLAQLDEWLLKPGEAGWFVVTRRYPLPRFLPYEVPVGIRLLCAMRPTAKAQPRPRAHLPRLATRPSAEERDHASEVGVGSSTPLAICSRKSASIARSSAT